MKFPFWVSYLKLISIFFCLLGVFWSISGSFDPFGLYDSMFAEAFWGSAALPADAARTKEFILGPFGATSAGFFLLQFFIAKHAYAKKQLWAYNAIIVGFFFWFILDTSMSLYHKAYFNIILANLTSLVFMLPILFTRKFFTQKD